VVGDTAADLQMGRAAGAGLIVAVLTGVGGRADLAPLADVMITSVEEFEVGAAS
jgi:phosphoglycolate phosphatase